MKLYISAFSAAQNHLANPDIMPQARNVGFPRLRYAVLCIAVHCFMASIRTAGAISPQLSTAASVADRALTASFNAAHDLAPAYSLNARFIWGGGSPFALLNPPPRPGPQSSCLKRVLAVQPPKANLSFIDASLTVEEVIAILPDLGLVAAKIAASKPTVVFANPAGSTPTPAPGPSAFPPTGEAGVDDAQLLQALQTRANESVAAITAFLNKGTVVKNSTLSVSYPIESVFHALNSFPSIGSEFAGMHEWALVPNLTSSIDGFQPRCCLFGASQKLLALPSPTDGDPGMDNSWILFKSRPPYVPYWPEIIRNRVFPDRVTNGWSEERFAAVTLS